MLLCVISVARMGLFIGQRIVANRSRSIEALPIIRKIDPIYPPLARQSRIQGIVRLSARIGSDGRIQQVKLVSGHPLLVPAAINAVSQWVYARPTVNGQPTTAQTSIDLTFQLNAPTRDSSPWVK